MSQRAMKGELIKGFAFLFAPCSLKEVLLMDYAVVHGYETVCVRGSVGKSVWSVRLSDIECLVHRAVDRFPKIKIDVVLDF